MEKAGLVAKAEQLQALIDADETLVLPNVWDVAGAHIVVEAVYPVIATSSAGIAWSFGYADGENISRDDMLFMVRLIARSVDAPVTADMEAGYGESADAVAATVTATLDAGAVGANIEDSSSQEAGHPLLDYDLSVGRIRAGKAAAEAAGVPFVINARTDVFFGGGSDTSLEDAIIDPLAEVRRGQRFYRGTDRQGNTVNGLLLNQDTHSVQLLREGERLAAFQKEELESHGFIPSPMPSYLDVLSPAEVSDLVAFMISLKQEQP